MKLILPLILIFIFNFRCGQTAVQQGCTNGNWGPQCLCNSQNMGQFFCFNATDYYLCSFQSIPVIPQPCEEGLFCNQAEQTCDFNTGATTKSQATGQQTTQIQQQTTKSQATGQHTTQSQTTAQQGCTNGNWGPQCLCNSQNMGQFFCFNATDYYLCSFQSIPVIPQPCEEGLFCNQAEQTCDFNTGVTTKSQATGQQTTQVQQHTTQAQQHTTQAQQHTTQAQQHTTQAQTTAQQGCTNGNWGPRCLCNSQNMGQFFCFNATDYYLCSFQSIPVIPQPCEEGLFCNQAEQTCDFNTGVPPT